MKIGDSATLTRKITHEDIYKFYEVSGDSNPVHFNEEYAKNTIFGRRIAHGILIGGLISAVLGTKMPGEGSIYLSQTFNFKKPVYLDDEITAKVTIKSIKDKQDKLFITCETVCINQDNSIVLDGEAVMLKYKSI